MKLDYCPAPWCKPVNGKPYIVERKHDMWYIRCPSCELCSNFHESEEKALVEWNMKKEVDTI